MRSSSPRRALVVVVLAAATAITTACGTRVPLQISGGPAPHGDATASAPQQTATPGPTVQHQTPSAPATGEQVPRTPPRPDRDERSATTPPREPQRPVALSRDDAGPRVLELQQRLIRLGYWLGETDGRFGQLTRQAVLAFQGWRGLSRDGVVGARTRRALARANRPEPDHDGDLIEIHRDRQVLLIVRDGRTRWALHTSTGSGERYTQPDGDVAVADTPAGTWEISWQVDGWRDSDLGRLWRPKYFHRDGLAIHGYPKVPAYPASHGCARVSIEAMNFIWRQDLAPEGSTVVVT